MPIETLSEKNSWLIASSRICKKRWMFKPSKCGVM